VEEVTMDDDQLLSRVRDLAGFTGRADAARAVRATVVALGERLQDDERAAFARALPPTLAQALDRAAYFGDFDRDELFARVARHENVEPGFAMEHAEVACRALGELLPEEALAHLRRQLGASIAELFAEPPSSPSLPRTTTTTGSTLATGREGSRHPLSEARPEEVGSLKLR
jgi:uncharacterized protein (DUF2267 family)